jgi:hypothetical protein
MGSIDDGDLWKTKTWSGVRTEKVAWERASRPLPQPVPVAAAAALVALQHPAVQQGLDVALRHIGGAMGDPFLNYKANLFALPSYLHGS